MGTIADKLNKLLGTKSAIRQAIVDMGQSVIGTASFSSYAAKIRAISSDATAAAGDILSGKTAYAGGKKITGTIPSRSTADLTASGAAVSVPAGHYPEAVSKSVAMADQATPGISVGSNGLITASVTQGAGYVAAGTKSATRQLTTQAGTTITPGTSAKTAVAAGRYTTGAVTVAGDANLVAANIKSGVSIFGVAGTAQVLGAKVTITVINKSASCTATICYVTESGYPMPLNAHALKTSSFTTRKNLIFAIFYDAISKEPTHTQTISSLNGWVISSLNLIAKTYTAQSSGTITIT